MFKKISDYEMTVAEWIGLAVMLAAPYLMVGVIWAIGHSEHFGAVRQGDADMAVADVPLGGTVPGQFGGT